MYFVNELVKKVAARMIHGGYLTRDMTVVAGISGGADSVMMLRVMDHLSTRFRLKLIVACLDHGLRGESKDEFAFVRSLAKTMGLPFHGGTVAPGVMAQAHGESVEMTGRRLRHRFLKSVREAHNASLIAV